jgi:hypothetical protein
VPQSKDKFAWSYTSLQRNSLTVTLAGTTMNDFLIKVERDSVCMGDDADAPHAYSFSALGTTRLDEIFEHLARQQVIPPFLMRAISRS